MWSVRCAGDVGDRRQRGGQLWDSQAALASSSNYDITSFTAGTLTVSVRPITVTADAASKIYGDSAPSYRYTITGEGLANRDSLSSVTLTSTGDAATADVGACDIAASNAVFGTGSASNYSITYATLTNGLTVNAAPLSITAKDVTAASLSAAQFSASYAGFVNGQTSALVSGL